MEHDEEELREKTHYEVEKHAKSEEKNREEGRIGKIMGSRVQTRRCIHSMSAPRPLVR